MTDRLSYANGTITEMTDRLTEHEIRTEKCSDICQHKIKVVLTFTKNDLTLVETYAITLDLCLDMCQIKVRIVQVNTKSARKMSDVRLLFHALDLAMQMEALLL